MSRDNAPNTERSNPKNTWAARQKRRMQAEGRLPSQAQQAQIDAARSKAEREAEEAAEAFKAEVESIKPLLKGNTLNAAQKKALRALLNVVEAE